MFSGFVERASIPVFNDDSIPETILSLTEHSTIFGDFDLFKPIISKLPNKTESWLYPSSTVETAHFIKLDNLVFDRFRNYTKTFLNQSKSIAVLYLQGADIVSHSGQKPSYVSVVLNNLDLQIRELDKQLSEIDPDYLNSTTFILTSDHGADPEFGGHGNDTPDETHAVFLAWGAGISRAVPVSSALVSEIPLDFANSFNTQRTDMQQSDLSVLMAHLLGLEIPFNSVGQLPLDILGFNSKLERCVSLLKLAHFKLDQLKSLYSEVASSYWNIFFEFFP
ncbi:Glycosyl phosphatidyl inositol anchor synthesis [Cichlidogyrus casuarinus]|uniref:GPI ethanolamine phosphate transferase 1 n=1 Tax=Cichlidogyrus casuarinus TaxID=1844966 RepID=A0ABD2QNV3_9PLAT